MVVVFVAVVDVDSVDSDFDFYFVVFDVDSVVEVTADFVVVVTAAVDAVVVVVFVDN